jgi:hypothetical protein
MLFPAVPHGPIRRERDEAFLRAVKDKMPALRCLQEELWQFLAILEGSPSVALPQLVAPSPPASYVTLDQVAAIVNRSKRTLERLKTRRVNSLPSPDVEGGGGRPDEWLWSRIRPWLIQEYGKQLPEHFPAARR